MNIASLRITGSLTVGGDANINGKLTVKNGSDFSGGNHIFRDAESKNGEWIRIGNPWGRPGIYTPADTPYVGSQIQTITCNVTKLTVRNDVVVNGMIQCNNHINVNTNLFVTRMIQCNNHINVGTDVNVKGNISNDYLLITQNRIQSKQADYEMQFSNDNYIRLLKRNQDWNGAYGAGFAAKGLYSDHGHIMAYNGDVRIEGQGGCFFIARNKGTMCS